MDVMKLTVCYHDWEKILSSNHKFIQISFEELKPGDIVMSFTFTYSQKYMILEGYEEYNSMKYGILLSKDQTNPSNSLMYQTMDNSGFNFVETKLYADPGSSGKYTLYKYIE